MEWFACCIRARSSREVAFFLVSGLNALCSPTPRLEDCPEGAGGISAFFLLVFCPLMLLHFALYRSFRRDLVSFAPQSSVARILSYLV